MPPSRGSTPLARAVAGGVVLFATLAVIALAGPSGGGESPAAERAAAPTTARSVQTERRTERRRPAPRPVTRSKPTPLPAQVAPKRPLRATTGQRPKRAAQPARAKRPRRALASALATSVVAHPRAPRVAIYASPQSARPIRVLARRTPLGTRQAFLVDDTRGDWVRVHLPTRPNGSKGWVKRSAVSLLDNHYRVEIDLGARRLTVYEHGRVLTSQTIAVGTAATPTPTGLYYIVELIRTTDPEGPYGPYAYALSAHSDVLQEFDGSDGRVGIHGTNAPGLLGDAVSHGCVRLRNGAITMLAKRLPLATPVRIEQ